MKHDQHMNITKDHVTLFIFHNHNSQQHDPLLLQHRPSHIKQKNAYKTTLSIEILICTNPCAKIWHSWTHVSTDLPHIPPNPISSQHTKHHMLLFSRDEDVTVPPHIRNIGFLNYMTPFHKEVCIDTVINTKNQTFSCHAYIVEVSTWLFLIFKTFSYNDHSRNLSKILIFKLSNWTQHSY